MSSDPTAPAAPVVGSTTVSVDQIDGTLAPGVVIGERYRLVARVAGGGMGEVWRATDDILGRTVALKVLRPEYSDDAEFRERLRREARAASAISHPGVVSVFDFGEMEQEGAAPLSFLVMEFVDGLTLAAEVAATGPLGPERTLMILEQAAAGLEAAHEAGVIHRDVKPGNLIITAQGDVKITDFGIAHASDVVPLTITGSLTGTAKYLSPEQARGDAGTAASDVYSLGVVAYACLTGDVPFRDGNELAIALAHVQQRPAELPSDVPVELRNLVMSMLSKDPADRPAGAGTVAELARDLRLRHPGTRDTHPLVTLVDEPRGEDVAASTVVGAPVSAEIVAATDELGPGRHRTRRASMIPVASAMVLVAAFFIVTHDWAGGVRVPDVVGQRVDAARSTLDEAGFRAKTVTVDAPRLKRGIVAKQSERPDSSIDKGSVVTLSVASGEVDLPRDRLIGASYDEAEKILRSLGLGSRMLVEASAKAPGTVISVSPGKTAKVGSTVTLSVAGRGSTGSSADNDKSGSGKAAPTPAVESTATPPPTVAPTTPPPDPTPSPTPSATPTAGSSTGP